MSTYRSTSSARCGASTGGVNQVEMQNDERRLVVVLGTSHALQMAENREDREHNVDDPVYTNLIEHFMTCFGIPVDFIFEEGSNCGPTAAERLAKGLHLKYMDFDPHPDTRHLYGLCRETGQNLRPPFDHVTWTFAEKQFKREDFWIEKMRRESFQAALVICGIVHTLSLSGRLMSAGFDVYAHFYMPHDKLCRKMHSKVASSSSSS